MVNVRIKVFGNERLVRKLSRINVEVGKLNIPMETIASHFWKINKENFEAQGQPKRFAPLSFRYKKWKDKNYPGKKIMQLTGRLMNSLAAENQEDAQDTIKNITAKYMEVGTDVEYAAAHNFGYPKRNLPARKIVQVTEKHRMVWDRIVQRWAYGLFEKAGFEVYQEQFGGII